MIKLIILTVLLLISLLIIDLFKLRKKLQQEHLDRFINSLTYYDSCQSLIEKFASLYSEKNFKYHFNIRKISINKIKKIIIILQKDSNDIIKKTWINILKLELNNRK